MYSQLPPRGSRLIHLPGKVVSILSSLEMTLFYAARIATQKVSAMLYWTDSVMSESFTLEITILINIDVGKLYAVLGSIALRLIPSTLTTPIAHAQAQLSYPTQPTSWALSIHLIKPSLTSQFRPLSSFVFDTER